MAEVAGPESLVEASGSGASTVELSVTAQHASDEHAPSNAAEVSTDSREASETNGEVREQPAPSVSPLGSPKSLPKTARASSISEPAGERTFSSPPDRHQFVSYNRGRVVSLDRGHELRRVVSLDRGRELLAEMEGLQGSSDLSEAAEEFAARPAADLDDDSSLGSNSSNGESSYFAKHLPSPKSERRWSYSDAASTSSAPAGAGPFGRTNGWKSDASLSFSDDEDDDHDVRPGMKIITSRAPILPPPVPRDGSEELPPYPQRITRIHSVNSLVSSSSDEGSAQEVPIPPPRNASNRSLSSVGDGSSTSSDPSVRAELRNVAVPKTHRSASTGSNRPISGRMPPVSGSHYPPFMSAGFMHTPSVPQGSPPPIYQGQLPSNVSDVAHPQPMTQEQMAAWLAAGNHMPQPPFMPPLPFFPPIGYGATTVMPNSQVMQSNVARPPSDGATSFSAHSTESGNMTLTMVYSEDEEGDDGNFHKTASSAGMPGYQERRRDPFDRASSRSAIEGTDSPTPGSSHDPLGIGHGSDNRAALKTASGSQDPASSGGEGGKDYSSPNKGFKVYRQRWVMLMYMSVLNLLSDWTCYSVAPISILTSEAFGSINPEQLVVVFLGANAIATACEPIILSRLGLRRTVVFGALLLMIGSIVKSGGLPPIVQPVLTKGQGEWRVYLGFFLVGLSQPLYQCTPALLSASWFPERERTMATGVALNANQLGIGFAFIFGTLLVATSDDIVRYFGLLSTISTVTFLGCLVQFDDAPPTPPSDTARAIRGTFQPKMPEAVDSIWKSVRSFASQRSLDDPSGRDRSDSGSRKSQSSDRRSSRSKEGRRRRRRSSTSGKSSASVESGKSGRRSKRSTSSSRKASSQSPRPSTRKQGQSSSSSAAAGTNTRRRSNTSNRRSASSESGLPPASALVPSPAPTSRPTRSSIEIAAFEREAYLASVLPPSPMMPGPVGPLPSRAENKSPANENVYSDDPTSHRPTDANETSEEEPAMRPEQYAQYAGTGIPYNNPQWQQQYWDPRFQQAYYQQQSAYQQQYQNYYQQNAPHGYYAYPQGYHPHAYPQFGPYDYHQPGSQSGTSDFDEGAEPKVTVTDHHLDIDIRDDQIILSFRACLARPGFLHALAAFTVSGIVINTLSTFMDYLVRLNGAGREYTGIVGGTFQFVIMISSLIIGKQTDRTRAYYSVILCMLVLGAFGLAECGVSLDADRGSNLRWTLIVVAALVGPLQPVSTELGVDVVYPLSENTVLVIQQLFSNLLSAMFIPFFKALKDVGTEPSSDNADTSEKPEYTFSFYLLIVLHAAATVFFATFNGRYIRYEQELARKAQEEAKMMFGGPTAFQPVHRYDNMRHHDPFDDYDEHDESQPLMNTVV